VPVAQLAIPFYRAAVPLLKLSPLDPKVGRFGHSHAGAVGSVNACSNLAFCLDPKGFGVALQVELAGAGLAVLVDIADAPSLLPFTLGRGP